MNSHTLAISCLIIFAFCNATFAQYPHQVGQVHADFAFPEIETGKEHKLSDFKGKKVVLINFASW